MATSRVEGLSEVLKNLNSQIVKIEGASLAGLLDAGLQIQGVAQQRTPVDTGNLKASAYTRKVDEKTVEIGFGAAYGVFVHENLESRHTVGQAKFLESAITDNQDRILEIIARRAQVSP